MVKTRITDLVLYRWRYAIGYGAIGLLLIASLIFAGLFIPGGITEQEMASTVASGSIDFNDLSSLTLVNLPYHLLQLASINLFGVSAISIKLPSLVLGLLTALGLIFLLRQWFRYNVAVVAAIIALTTSQFLFIAQNGTPLIMHLLWPVWILLTATLVARQNKPVLLWRVLFFILAGLSLYTPLSIYILITIAATVALHPHLRYLFRRIPTADIVFPSILTAIILVPLGYKLFTNPQVGMGLLGIANAQTGLLSTLPSLAAGLLDFRGASVTDNGMLLPLFSLGSILLIVVGIIGVAKARHSVKAYLVLLWILLLTPAILSDPIHIAIAFVPLVLLLANGLSLLFRYWYRLFPKNPYARIAGLLPLAVLVGGLVTSGLDRYTYGYQYHDIAVNQFSKDISLVNQEISKTNSAVSLVVPSSQTDFYATAADRLGDKLQVSNEVPTDTEGKVIVSGAKHDEAPEGKELERIVSSKHSDNADRFYVYRSPRT